MFVRTYPERSRRLAGPPARAGERCSVPVPGEVRDLRDRRSHLNGDFLVGSQLDVLPAAVDLGHRGIVGRVHHDGFARQASDIVRLQRLTPDRKQLSQRLGAGRRRLDLDLAGLVMRMNGVEAP